MATAKQMLIDFAPHARRQVTLGAYGALTRDDMRSLDAAQQRVLGLLKDGQWHKASEIIAVARQREGIRRLRELRAKGYDIEPRRHKLTREYEYRLTGSLKLLQEARTG